MVALLTIIGDTLRIGQLCLSIFVGIVLLFLAVNSFILAKKSRPKSSKRNIFFWQGLTCFGFLLLMVALTVQTFRLFGNPITFRLIITIPAFTILCYALLQFVRNDREANEILVKRFNGNGSNGEK